MKNIYLLATLTNINGEINSWVATRLRLFSNTQASLFPDQLVYFGNIRDASRIKKRIAKHFGIFVTVVTTVPFPKGDAPKTACHTEPAKPGFAIARTRGKSPEYMNVLGEEWSKTRTVKKEQRVKRVRVFLTPEAASKEIKDRKRIGFHVKDHQVVPSPV
jgi:hypothetical protein